MGLFTRGIGTQGRGLEFIQTIVAIIAEQFPRTRPTLDLRDSGTQELVGSMLNNIFEGGTAETLRQALHDSPEGAANRETPAPAPTPEEPADVPSTPTPAPDPSAPRLALPFRQDGARGWRDMRGGRPLLFASFFAALYWAKHDRVRLNHTLDLLQSWGVDGIRYFVSVATDYWDGRRILPVDGRRGGAWPDFNDAHTYLLEALRARGMGAHVTAGDGREFHDEMAIMRKASEVIRNYTDVVGMADWNEAWQNCRNGEDPAYVKRLLQPIIDLGIPWATSAHPSGDDKKWMDLMTKTVGAPVCTIHGPGGTTHMVRHIFNHRFEGAHLEYGLWQGEPRGPGDDVSAGQVNAAGWVVLAAAASAMTGQGYVLHCSRGIRDRDNDVPWEVFAPYFTRARRVLDHFPRRNPVAWGHGGRGGSHAEAVLVSTRPDGLFHEDAPGVKSQFHRCDVARLDDGQRIVLVYGGLSHLPRTAKFVKDFRGAVIDTHGLEVEYGNWSAGSIFNAPGNEDGYVLIER